MVSNRAKYPCVLVGTTHRKPSSRDAQNVCAVTKVGPVLNIYKQRVDISRSIH